jgi:hypothetical protein
MNTEKQKEVYRNITRSKADYWFDKAKGTDITIANMEMQVNDPYRKERGEVTDEQLEFYKKRIEELKKERKMYSKRGKEVLKQIEMDLKDIQ